MAVSTVLMPVRRASSAFTRRIRLEEPRDRPCRSGRVVVDDDTDVGCRPRSAMVASKSAEKRRAVESTLSHRGGMGLESPGSLVPHLFPKYWAQDLARLDSRQARDKGSQVQILSARPNTASDLRKRGAAAVRYLNCLAELDVY